MRRTAKWDGAAIAEAAKAAARRGLALGAEHILAESRKLVPHEEGTLERSGVAAVDEAKLLAVVSYDTPYAVRQHEDLGARHDDGRSAKFLEGPMQREGAVAMEIVAAEIRRALK